MRSLKSIFILKMFPSHKLRHFFMFIKCFSSDSEEPSDETNLTADTMSSAGVAFLPDEEQATTGLNTSSYLYIQMEYCEKKTLRDAIDSEDLVRNRHRMWILFRQMVEGIRYFHSEDIIHRDLKVNMQHKTYLILSLM